MDLRILLGRILAGGTLPGGTLAGGSRPTVPTVPTVAGRPKGGCGSRSQRSSFRARRRRSSRHRRHRRRPPGSGGPAPANGTGGCFPGIACACRRTMCFRGERRSSCGGTLTLRACRRSRPGSESSCSACSAASCVESPDRRGRGPDKPASTSLDHRPQS
ncbi:hypothetical protein CRV24_005594 [Beauveria bassiana]|nr:hypothetical protein CRV24_005594 [Beauveria bassiana]